MTPNQLKTEILHRLHRANEIAPDIVRAFGIDPTARPDETDDQPEFLDIPGEEFPGQGDPIRGHVLFDVTLSALGKTVTHSCRATYVIRLYDEDVGDGAGTCRAMSEMTVQFALLDWESDEPHDENLGEQPRVAVPSWRQIDPFLIIPRAIQADIDDLIFEQARAVEQSQLSN